jgi:hypothetical protein
VHWRTKRDPRFGLTSFILSASGKRSLGRIMEKLCIFGMRKWGESQGN